MAYNAPGTRFEHNQVADEDIEVEEAELPTCLIGPLFQVLIDEVSDSDFDPLTQSDQTFVWPGQKAGTQVDLAGTRNGVIDSQRRDKAPFVPTFKLKDDRGLHDVDDGDVRGIDDSGFDLDQEARDGLHRADLTAYPVQLDDTYLYYKDPAGDRLSTAEAGDRFLSTNKQTVQTVTDTRLYIEDNNNFPSVAPSEEGDSTDTIDAQKNQAKPGRVDLSGAAGQFSSYSVNDVIVTGYGRTGFKDLGDGTNADVDTVVSASELDLANIPFTQSISQDEVDRAIVKVKDDTSGESYFGRLKSIDTSAQTLTVDEMNATGWATSGDNIYVTIYRSQVGYIEEINSNDDTITAVVPDVFAETVVPLQIFDTSVSFKTYPMFQPTVTYRALRQDLVGNTYRAGKDSEIKSRTGASQIHPKDGLNFYASQVAAAQPNARDIRLIPVDTFTNGVETGYNEGIDRAKNLDIYMMALLDHTPGVDATLESHVTTQSDADKERRGMFIYDIPLGDYNQDTGEILPGRTNNGVVEMSSGSPVLTDGNKVIRDADIDFVTEGEVEDGTEVTVTYPSEFAGTYKAKGITTDNDLILYGDNWDITREFAPDTNADDEMTVTTNAGVHEFREPAALSVEEGRFAHVEEGDYVEAEDNATGTWYRMRIVSVLANGKGFDAVDEVAGSPTFSSQAFHNVSIIRSWGYDDPGTNKVGDVPPNVEYHIRPLSKDKQVDRLISLKTQNHRRQVVTLRYTPEVEYNAQEYTLDAELTVASVAAKRSGMQSHDEITNLFLGGYITGVDHAYEYFDDDQLDRLADHGFMLLTQESQQAEPTIRDMITSSTSGDLIDQEDIVISNLDWQAKTIRQSLQADPGRQLPRLTDRLLGVRAIQLDATLKRFGDNGRLRSFQIINVSRNDQNERQTDLEYDVVVPTSEKEIKVTANEQV